MTEELKCCECGRGITDGDEFRYNEESYCEDCYNDKFGYCEGCSDTYELDDMREGPNEHWYCEDCFDNRFFTCSYCHDVCSINNRYSDDCEDYCESCWDNIFTDCCDCGVYIPRDEACWDEDDGPYCERCFNRRETRAIHEHDYKPSPKFKRGKLEKRNKLFFGIELEVEAGNGNIGEVSEHLAGTYSDNFYLKHDGSISNGFELVWEPVSWDWIKENCAVYNKVLSYLINKKFSSYAPNTCGIHIHLSKNSFSTLHLLKFLTMFYSPENYKYILAISQRKEPQFKQWAGCHGETKDQQILKVNGKTSKYDWNRYTAVNLQNDRTVEIRIFRGTLKYESFLKNLEFVHSMFRYTELASLRQVTWAGYSQYVSDNQKTYRNLYAYMDSKNLFKYGVVSNGN